MYGPIRTIDVAVDIPVTEDEPDVDRLRDELRTLWLVEQVRLHRIGIGKAAQMASLPRAAFMSKLGEHGVPVIDYPLDDFERELEALGIE